MNLIRRALVLTCMAWWTLVASAYDVLEIAAVDSPLAQKSMVYSVKAFHGRLFATGQRGHILISEDDGANWRQADVPVRSDLLDVYFPSEQNGWVVGHDGVILHSSDGGNSWQKQFDGFRLGEQGLAWYQQKQAENPEEPFFEVLVGEMEFAIEQGADKPFFRVWFEDDQHGYVLGAYGVMLETQDGGQTWRPIMEIVMYDQFVHLYDACVLPDGLMMVGEMGYLLRWNAESGQYEMLDSPYEGSFFTCLNMGEGKILIAGLRGQTFFTENGGEEWNPADKPATDAIVDSVLLADGRVVLISANGEVLLSDDSGESFATVPFSPPSLLSGVVEVGDGRLLLAGAAGIRSLNLAATATN